MKKINNRWVDDNNNSWDCDIYTKDQAEKYSKSLIDCSNCSDCSDCSYCSHCRGCRYCRGCNGWKQNPERVVSPLIGSRKDNTTIYFSKDRTEVVCGCFRGTLEEFKQQVQEIHGDNQHGEDYMAWINRVEKYINGETK